MRRLVLLMLMSLFLVGLFASVALAEFATLTRNNDEYEGNPGPSTIFAKAGNDLIFGGPEGDSGRDRIFGGPGDDDLYGGEGRDKIFGDLGDDYIVGGPGEDQLNGGVGNDVIVAGDDKVADEVDGGDGFDICYLSGPDHSSLAQRTCEEIISFGPNDDLSETQNPGGIAGDGDGTVD